MLKRSMLLIFILLLTVGCKHRRAPEPMETMFLGTSPQTRSLPAFNHIVVNGALNVNLYTGDPRPHVVLRGDPRDISQLVTKVVNNTLTVAYVKGKPKYGSVLVEIHTRNLNSFVYAGGGEINGQHIRSNSLDLDISNPGRTRLNGNIHLTSLELDGPGYTEIGGVTANHLQLSLSGKAKVQLIGVANLSNIDLDGDGWFGVYWVNSNLLTVRARGKSTIKLAGIANKLDLELWDRAHFNGRYLRTRTVFAKTHNHSVAEITTLKRQHTLATEASDIYFYKIPEMKADFMAYNGSVLDMRGWNPDNLEDYNRYNK
jgi:hypothetical protein